jgi:hypothetical protein
MKNKRSLLTSFDLFTPDVKLNVAGKSGVATKVGAALSALYLAALCGMAFVIISEYFNTKKPLVSQAVVPTDLPPPISFSEDKLYPMLIFQYQVSVLLNKSELDRFVTVEFNKISMSRDEVSGKTTTTIEQMKAGEREVLLASGVCVDPENGDVTLGQKTSKDPFYQLIVWRVLPCSLPSGCASREELAKVTFSSMIPKPIQDLANHNNPIRYVTLADEILFISTAFTTRQNFNLIKTEIRDESGFLSSERLAKSYSAINSRGFSTSDRNSAQLSCTQAEIVARSCIPYFIQNFVNSPQKMVIKRQYKGMVETFSELGGMVDMLFMLFFFPYSIYNHRALRERLVEAIHGAKKPAKHKPQPPKGAQLSAEQRGSQEEAETAAKRYSGLLEQIETSLDVVQIAKELIKTARILECLQLDQQKPCRQESDLSPADRPKDKAGSTVIDASSCQPYNTVTWNKAGPQHPHTVFKKCQVSQKKTILNHHLTSMRNNFEVIRDKPFKIEHELNIEKPPGRGSAFEGQFSLKPRKEANSKEAADSRKPFEDLNRCQ